MIYLFTATFTKNDSSEYNARVPDLPGCITTGKDLSDVINQMRDAMALWLVTAEDEGLEIPTPTPQSLLHCTPDTICSVLKADTVLYRSQTDTRATRKNVSLPL